MERFSVAHFDPFVPFIRGTFHAIEYISISNLHLRRKKIFKLEIIVNGGEIDTFRFAATTSMPIENIVLCVRKNVRVCILFFFFYRLTVDLIICVALFRFAR